MLTANWIKQSRTEMDVELPGQGPSPLNVPVIVDAIVAVD